MWQLNEKQERFCQEYLVDLNQRQAYIRAGYSAKTADVNASRLMANAKVRARVDELMAERSKRTGVSQDRIVRELARIAFVDPTKVLNFKSGELLNGLTEDDRAVLAGIKYKDGEDFSEREIRLCDKVKALELLGKHLGMFTDKLDVSGGQPIIIDNIPRTPYEVTRVGSNETG